MWEVTSASEVEAVHCEVQTPFPQREPVFSVVSFSGEIDIYFYSALQYLRQKQPDSWLTPAILHMST